VNGGQFKFWNTRHAPIVHHAGWMECGQETGKFLFLANHSGEPCTLIILMYLPLLLCRYIFYLELISVGYGFERNIYYYIIPYYYFLSNSQGM
jgi:hypothetical protein